MRQLPGDIETMYLHTRRSQVMFKLEPALAPWKNALLKSFLRVTGLGPRSKVQQDIMS